MTRINLLPWREELKKQRQTEFFVILGITAAIAVGVWYAGHWHWTGLIEYHEQRNAMIEDEIAQLEREIEEIEELETVRDQLLARMSVIEELQAGRPQIVHTFEEIATTLPDGVYLERLEQSSSQLTVSGVAQSNARVSSYMENLDASDWLREPELEVIEVTERDDGRISDFRLNVEQTDPGRDEDNGEDTE